LIYHKIGSGKTCTAINIAENMKKKLNIMVILPAAIKGNFMGELRSHCAGEEYLTDKERKKLKKLTPDDIEYKNIMTKSKKRIDKYYTIYSYHKFVELVKLNKIKLKQTLLIIDEIQNMISERGIFYKSLKKIIDKSDDKSRILLLSATPMFDKPVEIALTLNLLKPKNPLPINNEFNQEFMQIKKNLSGVSYQAKNIKKFKSMIQGLISYYRGAPPAAFPEEIFKIVRCKMSDFQYKTYLGSMSDEDNYIRGSFRSVDILNMPNNFFIGPRIISNIAFPNKSVGLSGFSSLKEEKLRISNIKKYSTKFYKIYKKMKQAEGPVFIYSNFKEIGGLKTFMSFLEFHGFKNYKTFGKGEKRFALWSGDESHIIKEEIKYAFNQKENKNGNIIKIILGSPSMKEGVSLLRVSQVHVMEPYWNLSRIKQIVGRAIRFCSHKDMPKRRRFVEVFLYLSVYPGIETIDEYIWKLAKKKNKLISNFETALKESAIDCEIFFHGNNYPEDEKPIKCDI
jgi:nucleoside-triphosphatase THEP1